jgi:hypothetical protein
MVEGRMAGAGHGIPGFIGGGQVFKILAAEGQGYAFVGVAVGDEHGLGDAFGGFYRKNAIWVVTGNFGRFVEGTPGQPFAADTEIIDAILLDDGRQGMKSAFDDAELQAFVVGEALQGDGAAERVSQDANFGAGMSCVEGIEQGGDVAGFAVAEGIVIAAALAVGAQVGEQHVVALSGQFGSPGQEGFLAIADAVEQEQRFAVGAGAGGQVKGAEQDAVGRVHLPGFGLQAVLFGPVAEGQLRGHFRRVAAQGLDGPVRQGILDRPGGEEAKEQREYAEGAQAAAEQAFVVHGRINEDWGLGVLDRGGYLLNI